MAEIFGTSSDTTLIGMAPDYVMIANKDNDRLSGDAGTDLAHDDYIRFIIRTRDDYSVKGTTKIDSVTAKAMIDRGGAIFVDVRSASEFAREHIPGAQNIGLVADLTQEWISEIAGKEDEVVFYCHGKRCPHSAFAAARALGWGFKNIFYFAEGYPAWVVAGYRVEAAHQ